MSGPNDPKPRPGDPKPRPGDDDPRPRISDAALEAAADMTHPSNAYTPSKAESRIC